MKTDKLFRRWKRRYRKLVDRQWVLLRLSRVEGQPGQIHDLRVTLRRLRILVRVGEPLLERESARAYRIWSRHVTEATSQLRDHDVTLEWLRMRPNTTALVCFLEARRQRLWLACRRHLMPPKAAVRLRIARVRSGRKSRLRGRYRQRFERLRARAASQRPRFFDLNNEERHSFRRTMRRLRHLRELALPKRKRARDKQLQSFSRPQTAMGEHQDLLVAEQILTSLRTPKPSQALLHDLLRQQARRRSVIRTSLTMPARSWSERSG